MGELSVVQRRAVAGVVSKLWEWHAAGQARPRPGQRARVGGREVKVVQWYTKRAFVAHLGPHPRPKPQLVSHIDVDLTNKHWCSLKPPDLRKLAVEIGCPHGTKQLVWEMARERRCRKRSRTNANKTRASDGDSDFERESDDEGGSGGGRAGGGGGDAGAGGGDLGLCSGCGMRASPTHTCRKCGRSNHPFAECNGIEDDGYHVNCRSCGPGGP